MARKKQVVTHLMGEKSGSDERRLVEGLYRVGLFSERDVHKHFSRISENRFRGMIKSGFIEKKGRYIYLTRKGQKYCEDKMHMKYRYKTKVEQIKHDLKLSRVYLGLSKEQRETWKTETQIRYEISSRPEYHELMHDPKYKDLDRKNFTPDATIYSESEGREIVVEVITSFYSPLDIEMKEEIANRFYGGQIYKI